MDQLSILEARPQHQHSRAACPAKQYMQPTSFWCSGCLHSKTGGMSAELSVRGACLPQRQGSAACPLLELYDVAMQGLRPAQSILNRGAWNNRSAEGRVEWIVAGLSVPNLLELHDVGMEELAVVHDLPRHKFGDAMATLDKLDGNLLPCGKVHCQLDLAKCSLPKLCMPCKAPFKRQPWSDATPIWRHYVWHSASSREAATRARGNLAANRQQNQCDHTAIQHLQAGIRSATFPPRTLLYLELPANASLLFLGIAGIAAKFPQAAVSGACMLDHNKLAGTLQITHYQMTSAAR